LHKKFPFGIRDEKPIKKISQKSGEKTSLLEDDEEMFEFEKIVEEKKKRNGKSIFRVRWKNYLAEDDTWEPAESFSDPKFISDFRKETKRKNVKRERKKIQRERKKRRSRRIEETTKGQN
jgi:hypothetical protein